MFDADVQTSVEKYVRISIPGAGDAITGQLIRIEARIGLRLDRITLRSGHAADASLSPGRPLPDAALPCWVSEVFATVHGLKPGARPNAMINGKLRTLVVVGVALAPEFIFAGLFGIPGQHGFGVFRVLRVLQPSEATVAMGTPNMELRDLGRLEVVAQLPSADAMQTPPGAPVRIEQ